jgi:hypothetical protein
MGRGRFPFSCWVGRGGFAVVVSHPWRKGKNAPRMGHPFFVPGVGCPFSCQGWGTHFSCLGWGDRFRAGVGRTARVVAGNYARFR